MVKEIDLSNIPLRKDGKYDWKNSVGQYIYFVYEDVDGELLVTEYDNPYITVMHKNKFYKKKIQHIYQGKLKNIAYPDNFKYEIGYHIKDNNRDMIILNREIRPCKRTDRNYNEKIYNFHCNKCGWNEGEIEESKIKQGIGCSCCSGHTVVPEINSVATTHPWVIDYIPGGYEEAIKITHSSDQRKVFQCPFCKDKSEPLLIHNIIKNHGFTCSCRYSTSFSERIMIELFSKLKINYIHQLTCSTFDWVGAYRYDFYLPDFNMILEMHGEQHYKEANLTSRSLEEEQLNDKKKCDLANKYVDFYFSIDCRESSLLYIKNSILLNNKLCSLLDISESSFYGLNPYYSSDYQNVCDLWNNTYKSISEISKIVKRSPKKVKELLILSEQNGDTNFHIEDVEIRRKLLSTQKFKPIYCVDKNLYFKHTNLIDELSEDIFGEKIHNSKLRYAMKNNKQYKRYTFQYITQEEFNKIKQESPERAFGDLFVLEGGANYA